jgi:RNA:NAD 2'-phosphotransferase (TPT1/KptA family)
MISDKKNDLPQDKEGFYPIKFLCDLLKNQNPELHYINRNHIVEFFFKDLAREVQFKGANQIRYDTFKKVDENEILFDGQPLATLFHSPTDLSAALISAVHILKNKDPHVPFDLNGYCKVEELCVALKKRMPFLSYLDRNHIVELFFKDSQHKIVFNGQDLIKYKIKKVVEPPDVLYFGTLWNLARKMKDRGIFSSTKKYIKLYGSRDRALQYAAKFATQSKDKVVALNIDSKSAYQKGTRFSTYEDGEYIVSKIEKEHILWPEKEIEEKR